MYNVCTIIASTGRLALRTFIFAASLVTSLATATAQVAPTAAEAAAYTGMHAAAQRGDAQAITRLRAAGGDVNARDSFGRTPLHVATFAKQREAVRALA